MKFLKCFIAVVLMLSLASPVCWGSVGAKNHNESIGNATTIDFSTGLTATSDGSTVTVVNEVSTGTVPLPINGFLGNAAAAPITVSTAPGFEIDNLLPAIVWADGETTPVLITFKVPDNYLSGGAFRLLCDSSSDSTPNQVDFDVYVNANGSVWDSAATNQTPVAMTSLAGTAETVTLTVATDFASLAAGQYVTLRLWRDDVAAGTSDLEVSYAEFYYSRK